MVVSSIKRLSVNLISINVPPLVSMSSDNWSADCWRLTDCRRCSHLQSKHFFPDAADRYTLHSQRSIWKRGPFIGALFFKAVHCDRHISVDRSIMRFSFPDYFACGRWGTPHSPQHDRPTFLFTQENPLLEEYCNLKYLLHSNIIYYYDFNRDVWCKSENALTIGVRRILRCGPLWRQFEDFRTERRLNRLTQRPRRHQYFHADGRRWNSGIDALFSLSFSPASTFQFIDSLFGRGGKAAVAALFGLVRMSNEWRKGSQDLITGQETVKTRSSVFHRCVNSDNVVSFFLLFWSRFFPYNSCIFPFFFESRTSRNFFYEIFSFAWLLYKNLDSAGRFRKKYWTLLKKSWVLRIDYTFNDVISWLVTKELFRIFTTARATF